MSCCGQGRAAARAAFQRVPVSPPAPPPPPVLHAPVALAFTGGDPLIARGAVTGLTYAFPAHGEPLAVDGRDASAFLGSGVFRRA